MEPQPSYNTIGIVVLFFILGFIGGRLTVPSCWDMVPFGGNGYVDASWAYLRLHLYNRREALQLSRVLAAVGVPIELTSDTQLYGLLSGCAALCGAVVSLGAKMNFSSGLRAISV